MGQLKVFDDTSEFINYKNPEFPVYVCTGNLSCFPNMTALCHWHDDIEFIGPIEGHTGYSVNGRMLQIDEGDGLIVQSRQLHYGYSVDGSDCRFNCILFPPKLVSTNAYIDTKFIQPLTDPRSFQYLHLRAKNADDAKLLSLYRSMNDAASNERAFSELVLMSFLYQITARIYDASGHADSFIASGFDRDALIAKAMIDYIHAHYSEPVSLDDVARSASVSKSKCCRIFKSCLNSSPIDFLNSYRIECALEKLRAPDPPITDVALSCGFTSHSYFSELFRRQKGITPTEYRNLYKKSAR